MRPGGFSVSSGVSRRLKRRNSTLLPTMTHFRAASLQTNCTFWNSTPERYGSEGWPTHRGGDQTSRSLIVGLWCTTGSGRCVLCRSARLEGRRSSRVKLESIQVTGLMKPETAMCVYECEHLNRLDGDSHVFVSTTAAVSCILASRRRRRWPFYLCFCDGIARRYNF